MSHFSCVAFVLQFKSRTLFFISCVSLQLSFNKTTIIQFRHISYSFVSARVYRQEKTSNYDNILYGTWIDMKYAISLILLNPVQVDHLSTRFLKCFNITFIYSSHPLIYKILGVAGAAPLLVTLSTALLAKDTIAVAGCVCSSSQKMCTMLSIDEGARRATNANTRLVI